MGLFGFGKKKKEKNSVCSCSGSCESRDRLTKEADVKVLGSGCAKCNELEKQARQALEDLSMDTSIDHVRDFEEIAKYGVLSTPALVYKGKVLASGRVLKKEQIIELIKKEKA